MKIYPKLSIDEKYWFQVIQQIPFPIHIEDASNVRNILESLVKKRIINTCIKNNKTYFYVK